MSLLSHLDPPSWVPPLKRFRRLATEQLFAALKLRMFDLELINGFEHSVPRIANRVPGLLQEPCLAVCLARPCETRRNL